MDQRSFCFQDPLKAIALKTSEDCRCVVLEVRFIHTLPVLMASRHSRESGNPGGEGHGDWMPAYAGMTFYWYRTCEIDI